jgi:hypothetical protein
VLLRLSDRASRDGSVSEADRQLLAAIPPGKYSPIVQQRIDRVLGRSTTKARDEALLRDRFSREGMASAGNVEGLRAEYKRLQSTKGQAAATAFYNATPALQESRWGQLRR